jgi:hypothetical protein
MDVIQTAAVVSSGGNQHDVALYKRGCVTCSRLWIDTVSVWTGEVETLEVKRPQIAKAGPGIHGGASVAAKEPDILVENDSGVVASGMRHSNFIPILGGGKRDEFPRNFIGSDFK